MLSNFIGFIGHWIKQFRLEELNYYNVTHECPFVVQLLMSLTVFFHNFSQNYLKITQVQWKILYLQ